MKKNYPSVILLIGTILLNANYLSAQTTETFETESGGSSSFTDNAQTFNITSETGETYDVFLNGHNNGGGTDTCSGCGWNGTAADNQFIDNTGTTNHNGDNNGTSFTIKPQGSINIEISSLYLFCSTRTIGIHSGNLTITGKRDNDVKFTFTKTSGFANPTTFTPNNGFTFIDFSIEGGSDNSAVPIDELIITGTGNLDYLALDAFTWTTSALSTKKDKLSSGHSIFPNPASDHLYVKNIKSKLPFKIYNLLGKQIKKGVLTKNQSIDISNLSKGIYFIRFKNGEGKKIIKE